jgi:hypothetical protein
MTDTNEAKHLIAGKRQAEEANKESDPKKKIISDPAELLRGFVMTQEYVSKLGKERFLVPNLLIEQHILTLIAMSGGGKTTYLFFGVCPKLAEMGFNVWYLDADSPASDHKRMKETADRFGFQLVNPDVNSGTDMNGLLANLQEIADASADLSKWVLIFDTLKKFTDLMSKGSIKHFYQMVRKLCNLGATAVLLGHANKYRDKEGNLVFEGTGDVRSDTDELIFLERKINPNGGIDVTTICSHERGAKVRGLFKPFSFHISESREITFHKDVLPPVDFTATSLPKATDDEIVTEAKKYLLTRSEAVLQKQLVQHVSDMLAAGEKRVRQVVVQNSEPRDAMHRSGMPFVFSCGKRNAHYYELAK